MAIIGALKRVKLLVVSVSNRVVSLCLCRTYDQAERQVVLPAVYSREKEEGLVPAYDRQRLLNLPSRAFILEVVVDDTVSWWQVSF